MKSRLSFWKGVLASALVFGCISSAFATSGMVGFSKVTLAMNGAVVFSEGESLEAGNGQSIPSSISYTDAAGGGTTYLPLAYISRLLDTPVSWDGTTNTVSLGTLQGVSSGAIIVTPVDDGSSLPLTREGCKMGPFTEVAPIQSEGFPILEQTKYSSAADYKYITPVQAENGRYISVTVTNKSENLLVLHLGREYTVGRETLSTQVPAGQTLTRTLRVDQTNDGLNPQLLIHTSYYGGLPQDMDFEISATQFNP